MKKTVYIAAIVLSASGLVACSEGGGGTSSGSAAENFNLGGAWEAEYPDKSDASGTGKAKGRIVLNGNSYTYSWYKKLIGPDNATVYDWTETARETGSVSVSPDYMEWTADAFGEAQYNQGNRSWTAIDMKASKNDYAIQYTLDGGKLTIKEDINLDGDFDDVFEAPETLTYTKLN